MSLLLLEDDVEDAPILLPPPPDDHPQDDDEAAGRYMVVARSAAQVEQIAHGYSAEGYYWGYGQCLKFSRTCAGAQGGVYDARTAWSNARYKHRNSNAPKGTPVFLAGGKHGHVTISAGNGSVWSTDVYRIGRVDKVSLQALSRAWNYSISGWSEDINNVHIRDIYGPPKPPAPKPPAVVHTPYNLTYDEELAMMQRYQVKGQDAQYVVTAGGAVHIKNKTHLDLLLAEKRVSTSIKSITARQLAELLEKE